jgi:hypothetical protein
VLLHIYEFLDFVKKSASYTGKGIKPGCFSWHRLTPGGYEIIKWKKETVPAGSVIATF